MEKKKRFFPVEAIAVLHVTRHNVLMSHTDNLFSGLAAHAPEGKRLVGMKVQYEEQEKEGYSAHRLR